MLLDRKYISEKLKIPGVNNKLILKKIKLRRNVKTPTLLNRYNLSIIILLSMKLNNKIIIII